MAAVNEWVAREYFELLGFLVTQPQKYKPTSKIKEIEDVDLLAVQPARDDGDWPTGMVWGRKELRSVARAVIGVRGWHTERFTPAVLKGTPDIYAFATDARVARLASQLGDGRVARILCLSGLPSTASLRKASLELLRENGIDGVILFRTMLLELVSHVDVKKNYEKSDLLQILRLIKNYDLLNDAQLELFSRKRRRKGGV